MKAICLPRRNRCSFWAFCSFRLTFFWKWELLMILFKAEAILASSSSKIGKSLPATDLDDVDSSTESTISTSLIHNIASERKSEQELTWVLNLIFQYMNDDGEYIKLKFRYLLPFLSSHRILWDFHCQKRIHGSRPSFRHLHCSRAPKFVLHLLRQVSLCFLALENHQ